MQRTVDRKHELAQLQSAHGDRRGCDRRVAQRDREPSASCVDVGCAASERASKFEARCKATRCGTLNVGRRLTLDVVERSLGHARAELIEVAREIEIGEHVKPSARDISRTINAKAIAVLNR